MNYKVHEINRQRGIHGEYHTLMPFLRKHPDKFYEYLRMPIECFGYILNNIKDRIERAWCNLHKQPIRPEEKLVVTIRFVYISESPYFI